MDATVLSSAELGKLKWRSRRGLLENDLIIERFYAKHGETISRGEAEGLTALLDLSDNDLLDLLLARKSLEAELDQPAVRAVLQKLHDALKNS